MKLDFINVNAYIDSEIRKTSFYVDVLSDFSDDLTLSFSDKKYIVLPGLADVHVHLREPGFSYKETILSGSKAAAHGGFTAVCAMPNLSPVPDCEEHLEKELEIIRRDAVIKVYPYGAITVNEAGKELADLDRLAGKTIAFSDDGKGVQDPDIMRSAMIRSKELGKVIVAHCEDNTLLNGGYIHEGKYASDHGHRGICSKSEWGPVKRDVELVRETGCSYHVCHVSSAETVDVIRKAKAEGLDVTCETAPHYLLLDDSMLREDGRFKMNPPIRDKSDRDALIEGIKNGTIDMIVTDHAPHSAEEKSRGLEKSLMGVSGIEISFQLAYTYLVKTGIITFPHLMKLMRENPMKRFGIRDGGLTRDFTVFDLDYTGAVDPNDFISMGKSTPFEGWKVNGKCMLTVSDGRIAYVDRDLIGG